VKPIRTLAWVVFFGLLGAGLTDLPKHHRVNGVIVSSTADPNVVPYTILGMLVGLGFSYLHGRVSEWLVKRAPQPRSGAGE